MKLKRIIYLLAISFIADTLFSTPNHSHPYISESVLSLPPMPAAPVSPAGGGPSQPEVQSFTPANVSEMVNLFSGDFSYNIPLMNVGGYPVNITYNQGVGMEEDAGCVGLGWNLSVGAVNRIVRGLPDDFSGDEIEYEQYQKPNTTIGVSADIAAPEVFGFLGITLSGSLRDNNYTGINTDASLGLSLKASKGGKNSISGQLTGTLGLNSDNGPYSAANVSVGYGHTSANGITNNAGINFGCKASSYEGFENLSFGLNYSRSQTDKREKPGNQEKSYANMGVSGSHSFNSITSMAPRRNCPMSNIGFSFKLHIGGEVQGLKLGGGISGFYMQQRIAMNDKRTPAYGYLFSQKAGDGDVLLDFQRDEETSVDNKVPNLPAASFTYDLFQVNGQGLSGQFRAYRNDVGILHDPLIESGARPDVSADAGAEFEAGCVVGVGVDVGLDLGSSQSGKWTENNEIMNLAAFKDTISTDPAYKPFYFKEVGESTLFDNDIYNATEDSKPVRIETSLGALHNKFSFGTNQLRTINQPLINHKTPRRNTLFSYLDASEAASAALEKQIADYPFASIRIPFPMPAYEDRMFSFRRKHHISEITVTKDDGIRYIYALPAYNIDKKGVSFNISGAIDSLSENLIRYDGSYSTHKNNTNGINQAFTSTTNPGYAYAYLLTDVVSPDYVDRTGDGPSPDDNGTYTKFNYHKASSNYRWRMPYLQYSAHYQSNTNNLHAQSDGDDMASFMYGEKEVWYNQSIETKNYVALFYYSPRSDARGVSGADGGIDITDADQQLLKLDSISLFTRVYPGIPIQTVHFDYDYSLCKGTPTNMNNYSRLGFNTVPIPENDNTRGKLTLKSIYFTYQHSKKGKLIRYKFAYQNNRNYDESKNDRWGNYKSYRGDFTGMQNKDFPYVQQLTKNAADREAAAWCLSRIITPANGAIDIQYESDDYAFVQDKPAMQMVKVLGFGRNVDVAGNPLPSITGDDISLIPTSRSLSRTPPRDEIRDVIYFKLPRRDPRNDNSRKMLEQMANGISELFFNMSTKIGEQHENVTGFMLTKKEFGLARFNGDTIGWLRILPPEGRADIIGFHPVTLAAFRYAQEYLPRIAQGDTADLPENANERVLELGNRLAAMFQRLGSTSQNEWMYQHDIGNEIDTGQSFIRLNNPYRCKYGGGARVKRIIISDNWNEMSGDSSKSYGVEYDYTKPENGEMISSGVATYEPEIGNDENPLYQPVRVGDYDDPKYRRVVAPVGRSLFPAANVGYAKVTVRSLQHPNIERTATGKTEHEFYTARDFPVFVNSTAPQMTSNMDSPGEQAANFFASFFYSEDRLTVSQGHVIQLNDMPGKPKSVSVYSQGNLNPASGTTYIYKTNATNPKLLNNRVDFISQDGTVTSGLASMECDFIIDTRYEKVWTWLTSTNFNVNTILAGIYPVPVFSFFGGPRYSGTQVHVVSTTKIIHQTGILDSIIAFDNGARVTTKNIAYDSETGQPLLTQTANEFKDKYYTLTVPAHWVETGMGHAGFNNGNEYQITTGSSGDGFATISAGNLFYKGDEVFIKSSPWRDRLWVDSVESTRVRLIDRNGNYPVPAGTFTGHILKVIRSGKRNMQSIPVGSITMQENPIVAGTISGTRHLTNTWIKVVNASAIRYSDQWQTYNIQRVTIPADPCSCNENENGRVLIQQLLEFVTRQQSLDFSNLTIPSSVVSDADKLKYFGSGPLVISSSTFGNCAEIRLNETCILSLCAHDGETLSGTIDHQIAKNAITPVTRSTDCIDNSSFHVGINFKGGNSDRDVRGFCPCIPLDTCHQNPFPYSSSFCDMVSGIPVNPYVEGILGNYRPLATYVYNIGERISSTTSGPLPLRVSGFYDDQFRPFWVCAAFNGADPHRWTTSSVITKTDPNGRSLETIDATGVYSTDLYGFNKNLVVASAQNASYNQIAFESFEDADYPVGLAPGGCSMLKHWPLFLHETLSSVSGHIVDTVSHTGMKSLLLPPGASHTSNVSLGEIENRSVRNIAYPLRRADLTGYFRPTPGEYYISAWLKKDIDPYNDSIYSIYSTARVRVNGVDLDNRTNIIDGWQQVWGTVIITEGQNQLSFQLIAGGTFTNFDDIRIQPVNSSMKTYVYRPDNLRLCAELDENNFATLYEYDEEGALTRVKKETELGIMTLKEVRFANPKTR